MVDREQQFIFPVQLCIGLYVHLDVAWRHHPFALSSFKVKDENQIRTILNLGLERIRYDPLRSDCQPLSLDSAEVTVQPTPPKPSESIAFLSVQVKQIHRAIRECEKQFIRATSMARQAVHKMTQNPVEALAEAEALINDMVDQALLEGDAIIQVMDGSRIGEESFFHPMNVTVLSLMMAKALKFSVEDSRHLGMAALFHDIGKAEIPSSVLMNDGQMNRAERALLHQHPEYGAAMVRNTGWKKGVSERIAKLISQHHEYFDGSGYPAGLKGQDIDQLAQILSLVNTYDRLCNPVSRVNAMTPYGALSYLFASERKRHDGALLNMFIKMLGIYPPGSIVMLSDGTYGIVVSVNPQQLLRPVVLLHDKRLDRDSPNIVNLIDDEDMVITQCLQADQLPREVAEYLQCHTKQSYYFRPESTGEVPTPA